MVGDGVDNNEAFGQGVAIGDFNGDHIMDMVAEVPGETDQGGVGAASIIYGTSTGLNIGGSTTSQQQNQFWVPKFNQIFFDNTATAANLKNGQAFLAANKTKPGVITTADGLQYKIISNPTPTAAVPIDSSTVHVIYTGTLINGTVFDASSQHPDSGTTNQSTFGVTGVVPGFAEMLKLMHVGEHVTVYLPSNLAYGTQGNTPTIPPNSVIIFDLTLVSIS
jgi:FKBP-type peptidyl-prolyl cis-trans isomerase